MSLSGALSNALSGLNMQARKSALVSSNISNATTESYGRRSLEVSSNSVSGGGVGHRRRDAKRRCGGACGPPAIGCTIRLRQRHAGFCQQDRRRARGKRRVGVADLAVFRLRERTVVGGVGPVIDAAAYVCGIVGAEIQRHAEPRSAPPCRRRGPTQIVRLRHRWKP